MPIEADQTVKNIPGPEKSTKREHHLALSECASRKPKIYRRIYYRFMLFSSLSHTFKSLHPIQWDRWPILLSFMTWWMFYIYSRGDGEGRISLTCKILALRYVVSCIVQQILKYWRIRNIGFFPSIVFFLVLSKY